MFNPLHPSNAQWRQWSWSTLTQVMVCCLTASRHYPNQCSLIISNVVFNCDNYQKEIRRCQSMTHDSKLHFYTSHSDLSMINVLVKIGRGILISFKYACVMLKPVIYVEPKHTLYWVQMLCTGHASSQNLLNYLQYYSDILHNCCIKIILQNGFGGALLLYCFEAQHNCARSPDKNGSTSYHGGW